MIRKYLLRRRPHKIALSEVGFRDMLGGVCEIIRALRVAEMDVASRIRSPLAGYLVPLQLDREIHYTCEKCGHVTIVPRE